MVNPARGRRPGPSTTREQILAAARTQFAEHGFEGTSMRSVARAAGVDQKLVSHWFGTKDELFAAAVEIPFEPEDVVRLLDQGPRDTIGERLAAFFVGVLTDPVAGGRAVAIVRSAASSPGAAQVLRDTMVRQLLVPVARHVGADEPELRAELVASQVVGLVVLRRVVGVEPLTSLPAPVLAQVLAPTVQRYLTEPLPAGLEVAAARASDPGSQSNDGPPVRHPDERRHPPAASNPPDLEDAP